MKKMIITTVLLATLTAVNAQDAPMMSSAPEAKKAQNNKVEEVEYSTDVMAKQLGLTEEQIAQVKTANESYSEHMAELTKAIPDAEARKPRGDVLRDNHDNVLRKILTPEQYEKMIAQRNTRSSAPAGKEMKTKMPHNE